MSITTKIAKIDAQIWLNKGEAGKSETREYKTLPPDMIKSHGYQEQNTLVIPSRKLVVVRLGMTSKGDFPLEAFISDILKAIPE